MENFQRYPRLSTVLSLALAVSCAPFSKDIKKTQDKCNGQIAQLLDGSICDADGDSVPDTNDGPTDQSGLGACRLQPEDRDGFEDDDGCPDPDNDFDRIWDDVDQCPDKPEDFNGVADNDGCPDGDRDDDGWSDAEDDCPELKCPRGEGCEYGCPTQDTDGDGYRDYQDQCPNKPCSTYKPCEEGCDASDDDRDGIPWYLDQCPDNPEDFMGPEDGCPGSDIDGDGVLDERDLCPREREYNVTIHKRDGCPDPDQDFDGVPDVVDNCPDQPEDDYTERNIDGCPADSRPKDSSRKPPCSKGNLGSDDDGDGIPACLDHCPDLKEDFAETDGVVDGCPKSAPAHARKKHGEAKKAGRIEPVCKTQRCKEIDTDVDGVPDAYDSCPEAAEDYVGEMDGCPEE